MVTRWFSRACLGLLIFARLPASEPVPTAGPGATKDDVIKIHGMPGRQSKLGDREILGFPQLQFTLEKGRVERVDIPAGPPAPAPRPHPPTTPSKGKVDAKIASPVDPWRSRLVDAVREASPRNARILALFTGSDWSPAGKKFQEEVALHPDFVNTFAKDCVFVRLDFPMRIAIAPDLRQHNMRLRERYGVVVYPTLLVLSATGEKLATVDFAKLPPGDSYRSRVISAVRLADSSIGVKLAPPPGVDPMPPPAMPTTPVEVTAVLTRARLLVTAALIVGSVLAAIIFWFVWRKRVKPPVASMAVRISEAASGVPSPAEIRAWPKDRLCAVTAGLAELEGYVVGLPLNGDQDLVLKRPGERKPSVFACCAAASEGVVHARRLRELVGTLTADGVPAGWFVATMGFGTDARVYADEQNLLLIDGERLLHKLRDLPPLLLSRVLLHESAERR